MKNDVSIALIPPSQDRLVFPHDRRTNVHNSSNEWEEKKDLFDEKTGRIWPNVTMSSRAKFTREYVVKQFWVCFVEDKFDLDNAIQTKAEFSHATAAMDRIGGWEEEEGEQENWVGARFAASIWIYTIAVVCNGPTCKTLGSSNHDIFWKLSLGVRRCP